MIASGTKELDGVEAVQLRGLRVGHIKNDYVEGVASRLEIVPEKVTAIRVVDVHTRIRQDRCNLHREELPRHGDERGIQLNIVDPLDRGMLQRLGDAAVHAAADQQKPPRGRVLQQRVVNRFFGGALVRRAGKDHAVVINAADRAGFRIARLNDCQVAVDRVARSQQVESPPQPRLRGLVQRRCNIYEEKDCKQDDREKRRCHSRGPKLFAADPEQQDCCHA